MHIKHKYWYQSFIPLHRCLSNIFKNISQFQSNFFRQKKTHQTYKKKPHPSQQKTSPNKTQARNDTNLHPAHDRKATINLTTNRHAEHRFEERTTFMSWTRGPALLSSSSPVRGLANNLSSSNRMLFSWSLWFSWLCATGPAAVAC